MKDDKTPVRGDRVTFSGAKGHWRVEAVHSLDGTGSAMLTARKYLGGGNLRHTIRPFQVSSVATIDTRRRHTMAVAIKACPDGYDLVGGIMAFEDGSLDAAGQLDLFSYLILSGAVWHLQGFYVRAAQHFIDSGYITEAGEITDAGLDAVE